MKSASRTVESSLFLTLVTISHAHKALQCLCISFIQLGIHQNSTSGATWDQ